MKFAEFQFIVCMDDCFYRFRLLRTDGKVGQLKWVGWVAPSCSAAILKTLVMKCHGHEPCQPKPAGPKDVTLNK
jgi:hypothetical protein